MMETPLQKASTKWIQKRDLVCLKFASVMILISIFFIVSLQFLLLNLNGRNVIQSIINNETLTKMHASAKRDLFLLHKDSPQTRHFWSQVMSQINDLFAVQPSGPSILLMLIPSDSTETGVCLIKKIQEILSMAFHDRRFASEFKGQHYNRFDSTYTKHQLDAYFQILNSHHVAVIRNLEKLPAEAAYVLHSYCDNENAPFKRALIILTVESAWSYDSLSSNSDVDKVDVILQTIWKNKLKDVDIPAILSRIANAPVLVKPEPISRIS